MPSSPRPKDGEAHVASCGKFGSPYLRQNPGGGFCQLRDALWSLSPKVLIVPPTRRSLGNFAECAVAQASEVIRRTAHILVRRGLTGMASKQIAVGIDYWSLKKACSSVAL